LIEEETVRYSSQQVHVSTQTDITINPNLGSLIPSDNSDNEVRKEHTDKGAEESVKCNGFHGYYSISNEQQMLDITGVTVHVFAFLLTVSMLPLPQANDKPYSNDKLLLFLMKLKLGVTYSA
jgi:hypothetical protein